MYREGWSDFLRGLEGCVLEPSFFIECGFLDLVGAKEMLLVVGHDGSGGLGQGFFSEHFERVI